MTTQSDRRSWHAPATTIDDLPSTEANREAAAERFRRWSRSYRGSAVLAGVLAGSIESENEMIAAFLASFGAET